MDFSETRLTNIIIHRVGNKSREEGVQVSKSPVRADDDINNLLRHYFLSPFKLNEYYNLHHENDIQLNEVYSYVSQIFDDPELLFDQSINLANHLYEQSSHPKIKEGELYTVYFKGCFLNDEEADAVGIFKSESKDTFLKIFMKNDNYAVESQVGININKLDKGCLIFNTEKDRGYVVAIVDNLSKGSEAQYWKDDFLKVYQRNDNFYQTQEVIKLCKTFVTEKLPQEFEITRADQAELLNKSLAFFKEKDDFTFEEYKQEVFHQPEIVESFDDFSNFYQRENDIQFEKEFSIETDAVRKQAKVLKSVIKLDKNFHIYVHGGRDKIIKGYDENSGLNFYQLFYKDEK